MVATTNNYEALLFEPEKNAYKGAWTEVRQAGSSHFCFSRLTLQGIDLRSHQPSRQLGSAGRK